MGVCDAPQWLLPAFVRSMKAVGAGASNEDLLEAGQRLITAWQSPDRRFHNLKHAIDMLARVDELADESHNPDVMRLAVWYHGCVFSSATEETYKRNGGEDEVASAAYAAQDLQSLGVPDKVTDRICALILNLKRHNLAREDIDAMALNDADLGTLAVEPQLYKRYRELVREEYAHIPDEHYVRARLMIVTKLLGRENLFSSPLGARWELAARQNLEAEKRRLEDALLKLQSQACCTSSDCAAHEASAPSTEASATTGSIPTLTPAQAPSAANLGGGVGNAPASAQSAGAAPATPASPSTRTPADGIPAQQAAEAPTTSPAPASVPMPVPSPTPTSSLSSDAAPSAEEIIAHTTTMESCAEDLDQLMRTRRVETAPGTAPGAPSAAAPIPDRASIVEAERAKLAEKLRAKAEEAKVLREARTGEFQPITAEIIDDGASRL